MSGEMFLIGAAASLALYYVFYFLSKDPRYRFLGLLLAVSSLVVLQDMYSLSQAGAVYYKPPYSKMVIAHFAYMMFLTGLFAKEFLGGAMLGDQPPGTGSAK